MDENGQPIAGVDIAAIREDSSLGRHFIARYQYWGGPSGASTGKNGKFRIGEMKPGRYYLEAHIEPGHKPAGSLSEKGYVPVFYPGSPTMATATAFCLGAGEHRKIEFQLKPRATYTVRGKLELPSSFKRDFEPLWGLRREDGEIAQGEDAPYVFRSVLADGQGHFVLKGVRPGKYKLIALKEPVRDWEFGPFEFDQVKRWATPIQVGDAAVAGIAVEATTLRYPASTCEAPAP